MKTCSKCRRDLAPELFHKRKASPDGLAYKCRECVNADSARWREENPGAYRDWHAQNLEHKRESFKSWKAENRARVAAYMASWLQKNRASVNARIAKRGAAKRRAVPKWADLSAIRGIYAQAERMRAETGIQYDVDHIVPLQSPAVCGLHWEGNLQIIPKAENIAKLNRYWPGMP